MARWNVEQMYPKLSSSDCWKDLPQIRHTKERDPKAKIAGARILDAYIAMADDKERDDAFGERFTRLRRLSSHVRACCVHPFLSETHVLSALRMQMCMLCLHACRLVFLPRRSQRSWQP